MNPVKARFPVVIQSLLFMILGNFTLSSYAPLAPFIKDRFLLDSTELGLITSVIPGSIKDLASATLTSMSRAMSEFGSIAILAY